MSTASSLRVGVSTASSLRVSSSPGVRSSVLTKSPVQARAPDQSQVMSPKVWSTGTILIGLVNLGLSVGVLQKQAASRGHS